MSIGTLWRQHRRRCLGVGAAVLIGLGCALAHAWWPAVPPTMTPQSVREPLRLTQTVTLRPAHTQAVISPVSGRVEGDVPAVGASVREGDILLTVLAVTAPAAAAPTTAPAADTAQADAWLAAGIITPAEHDRLIGARPAPAAPAAAQVAYPLTAPISGRIGRVDVAAADPLLAGGVALTIQATDPLLATLVLPPAWAALLAAPPLEGITVTLDTAPARRGELAAIDTAAATPLAKLRFANSDASLTPESDGTVTLRADTSMTVTHLPLRARVGTHSVTVVDRDGVIDLRRLTTAYTTDTEWVILDGLEAGDRVITAPSERWPVGRRVDA